MLPVVVPASSLFVGGVAVVAGLGWLLERRRRRSVQLNADSIFWAGVETQGGSLVNTEHGLDEFLHASPQAAQAARSAQVMAVVQSESRREATLMDLHQLRRRLTRRLGRCDPDAAVQVLLQHLVEFRYTSPWVFLELRELYRLLNRQGDWQLLRPAFCARFGQNPPAWEAASTAGATLMTDKQLCGELSVQWPQRAARVFMLRWLLGEPESRKRCSGPPLLGLGVYRDLLFLDSLLDEVMHMAHGPAEFIA